MTPYVTLRFYRILFRERGMAGLHDELKPGRTRSTNEEQVTELINTAPRSEPRDPTLVFEIPALCKGSTTTTSALTPRSRRRLAHPSAAACRSPELLPRHGDADGFLRRDEVIGAFGGLGDGQLNAVDVTCELVAARAVVR